MKRPENISLRAAARALGVALSSVQAARDSGRITWPPESIERLRSEWIANTREEHAARPLAGREAVETVAPADAPEARSEALRRATVAKADILEAQRAQQLGELILASEAKAAWGKVLAGFRARALALPSRAKQAIPTLSVADVTALHDLVREMLQDLATGEVANG